DAADEINQALFVTDSEQALYDKYVAVKKSFQVNNIELKAEDAFEDITSLVNFITDFFDNNMFMAEDEQMKVNHLSIVKHIRNIIKEYADLTVIELNQHIK